MKSSAALCVSPNGDAANPRVTVASAAYLSGLNALFPNLQPVILGALATSYGLADAALGQLSASFIACNTLCMLTAPLWIRSVNWRWASVAACAIAALLMLGGLGMRTLIPLLVLFGALGTAKSVAGAASFMTLGDTSNPDRSFGFALIVQSAMAALAAIPLSGWLIPRFGAAGVYVALAVAYGSGVLASRWLPTGSGEVRASEAAPEGSSMTFASVLPALVALFGIILFVAGAMGFWFFIGRIGVARGIAAGVVGLTVSLSALATIVAAGVVAWGASRWPSLAFVAAGCLVTLVGFSLLWARGDLAFIASVFLFSTGYGLAQPSFWAVTRSVDATGRLFVAAPAASGAAGVAMGMLAGPIIDFGGYMGLIVTCALLFALSAAAMAASTRAFVFLSPRFRRLSPSV